VDERERQLERLRTLRDSGALTATEYEQEKARLEPPSQPLAAAAPPVEPPPAVPPIASTRRFNPWLVIAPLAVIAIGVAAYFLLAGRGQQSTAAAANAGQAGTPTPSPAPPGDASMRDRPEAEQLDTAFRAVFGQASPVERAEDEHGGSERALRLLWTGFGPVLLTERTIPDARHAASGSVSAFYLRDTGAGFEVAARYPHAAASWEWDEAPEGWQVVDNFTSNPAIYRAGSRDEQGYATAAGLLVEFRPEGPSLSQFDLGADNSGALGEGETQSYAGEIRNVVRDRSLEIVYTGTCEFTRRYLFQNNRFEAETGLVPECAG